QAFVFPVALIEVQYPSGLPEEVRGAGEDPVFVLPGLDGIPVEDAADRRAADRLAQLDAGQAGEVAERQAAQGRLCLGPPLTNEGGDEGTIEGGKRRLGGLVRVGLQG